MHWRSERAFVKTFAAYLSRTGRQRLIWTEIPTTYGEADIIAADYYFQKALRRSKRPLYKYPLTQMGARLLSFLAHFGNINQEQARALYDISQAEWGTTVDLLQFRSLATMRDGELRTRKLSEIFVIKSLAIYEAKLSGWRRAVEQARRHLWLTASCFVLLPSLKSGTLAQAAECCKKLGIGLVLFDRGRETRLGPRMTNGYTTITPLTMWLNEKIVDNASRRPAFPANRRRD